MKLVNKNTTNIKVFGEIVPCNEYGCIAVKTDQGVTWYYRSLAELNEEWEDYEEPKEYWIIDTILHEIRSLPYKNNEEDKRYEQWLEELGLKFETKEEAEKAVEKLKAWKRLKDNGFKIKGWKFTPDMKQIQGNYVKIEAEIPQILINEEDIDLLFGGEE